MWRLRRTQPPLGAASDNELIILARAGGEAAFREIMRRNNRRLFRTARGIVGSDWEAEEVVQDAYVAAFRALAGFRGDAALATWLTRIVVNEANGRLRRRRESVSLGELDEIPMGDIIQFPGAAQASNPERQAALEQIRGMLEGAIDALPQPFRAVFVLREVEGLSIQETAEVLAIPPETVKTRLHRARTRLRQQLQEHLAPVLKDAFPFAGARCDSLTRSVLRRLGLEHDSTR